MERQRRHGAVGLLIPFGGCGGRGRARIVAVPKRRRAPHVPLAGLFGNTGPDRTASLRGTPLADRPEPPFEARRGDDERRRLRSRLVRRGRAGRRVPQRRAGLERSEPARAGRARALAARVRAHPRVERRARPADELPSVPPRPFPLDAQRADPRLPQDQARAPLRGRPGALPGDRRHDGLGDAVLPRADVRPRERPARRPSRGRSASSRRSAGGTASSIRSRGRSRRRTASGSGPSATRARAPRARSSTAATSRSCVLSTRTTTASTGSATNRASSSPSRSAICPGSGTRCPRGPTASSSPAPTSSTRSCRSHPCRSGYGTETTRAPPARRSTSAATSEPSTRPRKL